MGLVAVVGGGWAGCAAAAAVRRRGEECILLERTDLLLGCGLLGGIVRDFARTTVAEETRAMGGGELYTITDQTARHREPHIPSMEHEFVYDIFQIEGKVRTFLATRGVDIRFRSRVVGADSGEGRVKAVNLENGERIEADVFVDATGSGGPEELCRKWGLGCVECVLRCPAFGSRVSLAGLAGVPEGVGRKGDRYGAITSGSHLVKESLSPDLRRRLEVSGCLLVPVPPVLQDHSIERIATNHYASQSHLKNIVLVDNGAVLMMLRPHVPLELLQQVEGLEHARYFDPLAGGIGNSVRFLSVVETGPDFRAPGFDNLFCAGEKVGLLVGIDEAVLTGELAGGNAARTAQGRESLVLPRTTAIGEGLAFAAERLRAPGGYADRYLFGGGVVLEHLRQVGLYEVRKDVIASRIREAGLEGILAE